MHATGESALAVRERTTLNERTALVTGGGSGLGRHIALHLAKAGCRVILAGRTASTLSAVADEVSAEGGSVRTEVCDVSSASEVAALAGSLQDEVVSVLVNNAGVGGPVADLVDIDVDAWDEVFAVNVRGTFLPCRAFLPPMVERGFGDVINIASVTGKRPLPGRTPYAASKMAILGLTATLAFEVGGHGVRVNSLSPGPVRGERMQRNFRLDAERTGTTPAAAEEAFAGRAATGRLLEEYEVGEAVVALLAMTGMTGADIDLSAGMVAR